MAHEPATPSELTSLARQLVQGVLDEAVAESRREAVAILRARLTAAILEEAEQATSALTPESLDARTGDAPSGSRAAGWYVYGVTWEPVARGFTGRPGVDGSPLEVVAAGPVAAVVSPVAASGPWGVVGDGDLDLHALAPRARQHEEVLEDLLDGGGVLPLRFGVMYPDLEPVRRVLGEQGPELKAALRRLEGHSEWGLAVSRERPVELSTVGASPDLRGSEYLERQRSQRSLLAQESSAAAEALGALHEALCGIAADTVVHRTAGQVEDGRHVLLRCSYLVARDSVERFRAAAEQELQAAPEQLHLTAELTGPWPPYHFCDVSLEGLPA